MTHSPFNHALQRTRHDARVCNHRVPRAGSQSLGRYSTIRTAIYLAFVVMLGLGTACFSANNFTNLMAGATAAYAQQNYERAANLYSKAVELETNKSWAYLGRGGAYLHLGRIEQAKNDFNAAVALETNMVPRSAMYMNRGYYYMQTTNYDKAVEDYSKSIQLNPSYQTAYAHRAWVFILQQRYDLAIMDCNMAIMLKPDDFDTLYYKGEAYSATHENNKAIEAYSKAIEINTNFCWAYYRRAGAYSENDDYLRTIKDFNRVIQLQPSYAEAFAGRGFAKSKVGDYKGAIEDCKKAVQLNTNSLGALNNLAWLLATAPKAKMRDGPKAVEYAKKACELSSWKNAYCIGTLAAAYAEVGNFEEAVKWERKCIIMGLAKKDMDQARKELKLFDQKKPYHADK